MPTARNESIDGVLDLVARLDTNWRHHLHHLLVPYACTLDMYLAAEQQLCDGVASILPQSQSAIFNTFAHCSFEDTCVVILGEPYTNPKWAHGLAYSIPNGSPNAKAPSALHAILCEIAQEYGKQHDTDLTDWVEQGVLLLNTSLTCREACKQTSHQSVWEPFVDRVIHYVSEHVQSVVFMLWGQAAKAKVHLIDDSKHLVLHAPHPACSNGCEQFAGCNHFAVANNWLVSRERRPVRWV